MLQNEAESSPARKAGLLRNRRQETLQLHKTLCLQEGSEEKGLLCDTLQHFAVASQVKS